MVTYVQPKVRFKCTLCGECCRRYWITVTVDDLLAILINSGLRPSEVSALYNANVAGDWQAPRIRLRDGYYYLVLRKRVDGSCIFNEWRGDRMICTIHSYKPLTCRFYPFIYHWVDDKLYFELYDKAMGYCPGVGNGPIVDLARESEYAVKSREAKERFRVFVNHWNKLVDDKSVEATVDSFMNYLDCVVSLLAGRLLECPGVFKVNELLPALTGGPIH